MNIVPRRRISLIFPFLLPTVILILLVFIIRPSSAHALHAGESLETSSTAQLPTDAVERAWELANASGVYAFRTEVEQTTDPALSLTNAGREKETTRLFIDGSVDRPAHGLTMDLWQNSRASQPLSVKVENGQTYGRMGESEWQEMDNIGDVFAPGGDPLGFLSGATNIQAAGTQSREFVSAEGALILAYEVYTFDFDGTRFAAHMQSQMEAALRAQGKLPPGMNTTMPDEYRKMTGQGEIWLDANGLPGFVQVTLHLPSRPNGDKVTALVQSELFDFDLAKISATQTSLFDNPTTWLAQRLPSNPVGWDQMIVNATLWGSMILLVAFVLRHWRSKKLYTGLAFIMIASMVVTPLLQSNRAAAFYDEQQAKQVEQEAARAEAEQKQEAYDYMTRTRGNPHQNPLDNISEYALEQAMQNNGDDSFSAFPSAASFAIQASGTITTTDSDDDGLSDSDETTWRTCAYPGAPEFCSGVTDSTDSDGDGLSDGNEVNRVGTVPTLLDTDGDAITDTVEVEGYTDSNNVTWYLDAYENDSNNDGLLDGIECPAWTSTAENPAPGSACPDTDGDGSPDIYDHDNDGDGVEDAVDASPFTLATEVFNQSNPLSLSVDGLVVDTPVFVTLQMRPTDPGHLTYFGRVMDWPSGDNQGQIQRVLDTTWANTSDTSSISTASDASYGDMRLVPYLEISIPYSSGHYGNLPVTAAYQGTTRSLTDSVGDWLDTSVTNAYGITVQDADSTSGDLLVYVPLTLVSDRNAGGDVAFGAKMMYWPSQGTGDVVDWGSDHSYRMVWFVQMLTDACPVDNPDCDDSERVEDMSVIHVYDEDWVLAGMEIVEDRGLEVGILYEDPAVDDNLDLDQQLWNASWLLGNTFLRGRDCPVLSGDLCDSGFQDDERDVTIGNALSELDSWASDAGDLSYLEMATFSYDHEGYLAHIMMTETVSLLESHFSPYAGQTVPTLLFLTERTQRSFNLDSGSLSGNVFSPNFDPAGNADDVPEVVMAGMNWASYSDADDSSAVDWQSYDPYEYLDYLDWQLQADDFFAAVTNDADDIDEAEGKRLWAQIYYIALYSGAVGMVEINDTTAWTEDPELPEVAMTSWPTETFYGATFVAFSFLTAITSSISTALKSSVSFWRALKYAFSYNYSFYTSNVSRSLKSLGHATVFLTAITIVLIVTGVTMFAVGFFTNDQALIETAVVILNIATAIVLTAWLFSIIRTLIAIVRVASAATNAARVVTTMVSALSKASRAIGAIGLVLAIAVAWGFFFYAVISEGLKPGSIEFNIALALVIAQTIVIIVLFLLEIVFGIVATIIILLIFIIDAILAIVGEQGIVDWLTEQIAKAIYNVEYVIFNLDDPDRLDFNFTNFVLSDPEAGFTTANGIYVTMVVTTTLDTRGKSDGKRATFRYAVTEFETEIHENYSQNSMNGEWDKQGNYIVAVQQATNSTPIPLAAAGTGINVDLADHLYLNEAAIIPYEGCWRIPIPTLFGTVYIEVDCTWYDTKVTNHIHVGEYQVYDILPTTIGAFASLSWSDGFPAQHDFDNDGMLSDRFGGVDPDDLNADMDGDGLTDTYELTTGTDPKRSDTDGDGLADPNELTERTNPLSADSDGDGLDDYTELVVGWLVVYDDNNHLTRIWSDPSLADADNDTLTDLEEFVFGFNPWTATDPSAINNLIAFDNINVHEARAPMMLFQFEEPSGAETFNDDYGRGYTATCTGSTCPASEVAGQFEEAVDFDGSDDRIQISNIDLANTSFSIAGWVNRDSNSTFDPLITHGNFVFAFNNDRTFVCGFGPEIVQTTATFTNNQWHHWACVYDLEAETLSLYVNGSLQAISTTTTVYAGNGTMNLGFADLGVLTLSLDGTLDEVGVYQTALTAAQITDLYNHKYIINDLIVAPGDPLLYQATVSNTHASQSADGLLTADARYFDPAIGVPDAVLGFESEEKISAFSDSVGQSTTATCISESTCPSTGAAGHYQWAIEFDGTNDYLVMPVVGKDLTEYTLAFWFYPTAVPVTNTYILDTESEEPGALDVYLKPDGKMVFDIAGGQINFICTRDLNNNVIQCGNTNLPEKPETAFTFTGGNLNQWWFIGVIGDADGANVYINPDNNDSSQLSFTVTPTGDPITHAIVGPGRLGNSLSGNNAYIGRMDDFIFYNQQVASPSSTNNKELSEKVYQGTYNFDYLGYSAKQVDFLLQFNESGVEFDSTVFPSTLTPAYNAECQSIKTCPVLTPDGYDGYGIELDGVDDYAQVDGSIYRSGTIDMTFYMYLDSLPSANHIIYVFDSASTADDWLNIYFDSQGIVYLSREGSSTARSCWTPCDPSLLLQPNQWNKVRIRISNKSSSGNRQYAWDFWINDNDANDSNWCSAGGGSVNCHTEASGIGAGWIGGKTTSNIPTVPSGLVGVQPFSGRLDELGIGVGFYPFEFDSMEVGFVNTMNNGVTAHCGSIFTCPEADPGGVFGDAILLDGVDDYLYHDQMDFVKGDYTLAGWFKTSDAGGTQTILAANDPHNSANLGVSIELNAAGQVLWLDRFPTGASGGTQLSSGGGYNDGQWHHFVAIKNGTEMTLLLDGTTANTATTNGYGTDHFDISIGTDGTSDYFNGYLDELVILPSAVADGTYYYAAKTLMNSPYPPLDVDAEFTTFNIPPLSATTADGTAAVDEEAVNSQLLFEQEVEAALQLQSTLSYPIIDSQYADLVVFLPFEEVPGETTFINYGENGLPQQEADFTCTSAYCPTAGLRGKVGRALFFDGVDDQVTIGPGSNVDVNTIAAWVYGDRGTVVKTHAYGGLELDFNRFRVWWTDQDDGIEDSSIPFDIPENQWVHLVGTYNSTTGELKAYVNGALVGTDSISPSSVINRKVTSIGANSDGSDVFHGFIDDFRAYDIVLSDVQVATLYAESTAQLHFEFDEDEHAAVFLDKSISELTAEPVAQVCYNLTLVSMTVNSLANDGSTVNFRLDDTLLARATDVSTGALELNTTTLLCNSETLEVRVAYSGTTTSLGTALIATAATTTTLNFSSGGDNLDLTYVVDPDPVYRVNPSPGTDGKIGNTALFDGEGYLTVDGADAVNTVSGDLTLMMWIMPEELVGRQRLVASARTDSINGFGFGLDNENLLFTTWGNEDLLATSTQIESNIWQHVAVVFESSHTARFYVDGVLQETVAGSFPISPNHDDLLMIGGTTEQLSNTIQEMFNGQLDELQVYNRSLSGAEIFAFYLRELRWYRDRSVSVIQVDADTPQVERLGGDYYPNEEIDLVISAVDTSSSVSYVDYAIKPPSSGSFSSWQSVDVCADSSNQGFNAAWCLSLDPTTMGGEGRYELKFRAYDLVGNTTEITDILWVDDTAPVVDTVYIGQWLPVTDDPNVELAWTLPITGTVSDPNIGADPGSGVLLATESTTKTLQVTLYDSNLQPAGEGTLVTDIVNGAFSVEYRFAGQPPHGVYMVDVSIADNVGNPSQSLIPAITLPMGLLAPSATTTPTVKLDARAPSVEMNLWNMPVDITQSLTLSGTIFDMMDPGGLVAQYHLEEIDAPFYDFSYEGNDATCATCPVTGTPGQFGNAITFNGTNQYLSVTLTNTLNILTGTFSAAMWVNVDDFTAPRVLLSQQDGTGTGASWLALDTSGNLFSNLGGATLVGTQPLTAGQWHHVALTYDGTMLNLYMDAALIASAARTIVDSDGAFILGLDKDLASNPFSGDMDEFSLFSRALPASDVYAIAQSEVIGVDSVEVWLEVFPFTSTLGTPSWQAATISQPGADMSGWQFPLPNNLEEFYRVHLQGTDAFGNTSGEQQVWRGIIDQIAPRITFTGTHLGGGSAAATEFSIVIDDLFVDELSIIYPCAGFSTFTEGYHTLSGWVNQLSTTCRIPGHFTGPVSVTACDIFGHCTTETITLTDTGDTPGILILEPQPSSVVPFSGDPVPVGGGAFDPNGITNITLSDQNSAFDVISVGGTVTDTLWNSVGWTPATTGTYTLTAVMQDPIGGTYTDTVVVTLETALCYAEINGDTTTDFVSIDESAVQKAVDAAVSGATIKLYGNCTGVGTTNALTQTVYISKSLTLEGGHTPVDWLAAPDTTTYPTILSAENSGRVVYVAGGNVTLSTLNIVGGVATEGAGVYNLGTLTVISSTLSSNSANTGGAIYNVGTLTLAHSTLTGNTALNGAALFNSATTSIVNSTVSGNTGNGATNTGTLNLLNATVYNNSGFGIDNQGTANLANSLLGNNIGGDCSGTITNNGHSFISDGSCGFLASGDLLLGALTDNGGPTFTHLPGAFSPAIDAVPLANCTLPDDQRGIPRPVDSACDSGSVELTTNFVPTAVSETYTTSEDILLAVPALGVLSNDLDGDWDTLTAILDVDVISGTLALSSTGDFTYTPDLNICGTDRFSYHAADEVAMSNIVTVTIQITCLPPSGNAGGPYTVDEGGSVVLDGTGSFEFLQQPPPGLIYTWDFDYDGVTFDVNGTGITTTFSAVGLDGPFTHTIGLRVTDHSGLTDTVTSTLTILNVVPTIALNGTASISETVPFTLSIGSVVDPGLDTITGCTVNWGDGNSEDCISALSGTLPHVYADGPYTPTITLDLTDEDGTYPSAGVFSLSITNLPPAITTLTNTSPITESESVTITVEAHDPAGSFDPLLYVFDCESDGTFDIGPQTNPIASCTFVENGVYTATMGVDDQDEGVVTGTTVITVLNAAPALSNLVMATLIYENVGVTLTGTLTDVGVADSFTLAVAWGDGTVTTNTYPAGTAVFTETHTYLDDNPTGTPTDSHTVTLHLTDDDGGIGVSELPITIHNLSPTVNAGPDQTVADASLVSFTGVFTDVAADSHTLLWDFGDGITITSSLNPSHIYPSIGMYTATLTVIDDDTGTTTDMVKILVTPSANLLVTQTDNEDPVLSGADLIYTLNVSNNGPSVANSILLTDTLPAGVAFVSASAGCSEWDGEVVCGVGSLSSGESVSIQITTTVFVTTTGVLENSAWVGGAELDPDLANNATTESTEVALASIVYEEDFEDGGPGDEWGCNTPEITTAPNGQNFLGELGAETVCLTLDNLPQHSQVTVVFDLYIIRSWDGNQVESLPGFLLMAPDTIVGPDRWQLWADGLPLMDTTFSNWPEIQQAYPGNFPAGNHSPWAGAEAIDVLGYQYYGISKDAIYHLEFTFAHSDSALVLDFIGMTLQAIADESWGVDNIVVSVDAGGYTPYYLYLPVIVR